MIGITHSKTMHPDKYYMSFPSEIMQHTYTVFINVWSTCNVWNGNSWRSVPFDIHGHGLSMKQDENIQQTC